MGIIKFFDRLEDRVRAFLSRWPIVYGFIGGTSIVLFWRGIWMIADEFYFMNGWVTTAVSVAMLLITGLFVSSFIGNHIIISGLKKEKKLTEKTEKELLSEKTNIDEILFRLDSIEERFNDLPISSKKENEAESILK